MAAKRTTPIKPEVQVQEVKEESSPLMIDGVEVLEGDWVTVKARYQKPSPHPEEVQVMLRSHNEGYLCWVLRESVTERVAPPDGWPRCPSMFAAPTTLDLFWRCSRSNGHSGMHECSAGSWLDEATSGYFEG